MATHKRLEELLDASIALTAKNYNDRKASLDLDWSELVKREDYLHTRHSVATRFEREIEEKLAETAKNSAQLNEQASVQHPLQPIQQPVVEELAEHASKTVDPDVHPSEQTPTQSGGLFRRVMVNGLAVLRLV